MGKYLAWRTAFLVGGLMGLTLLGLRFFTHDSSMFQKMELADGVKRGSLKLLLLSRTNCLRFLSCIALGVPIYLTMGIFATFSPEIASAFGLSNTINIPNVLLATSAGMTIGDLIAGTLSQALRKRKLPLGMLLLGLFVAQGAIASGYATSERSYILLSGLAGVFGGYWACLLTTSAEQFGTNIRATATTMIPNLIRATAIPLTSGFVSLKTYFSVEETLWILVGCSFTGAFLGLMYLTETFHRDLDFYEH
jgi:MFS family permease